MKEMEDVMRNNDEITARGLKGLVAVRWPEVQVSISTIKRVRKELGWVCTRLHYCQLLQPVN